jgi:hypothetical protein
MEYDKDAIFAGAAAVAAKGWKIVRLWGVRDDGTCTCGRDTCKTPGKHPHGSGGWQHRASDNEDEILRWFDEADEENSRSNIGVRLGPTSGIIDVEFDSPDAERAIIKYGLDRIDTPSYSSGRGVHRIFAHEDWMPDSGVVKVEGVEVRIGGGETASQSVIPPSWHMTKKQYGWLPGRSPEDVNPAKLPTAFREAVMAASRRQGSGITAQARDALRSAKKISEGGRHAFLVGIASREAARISKFSDTEKEELTMILLAVNATFCVPPKGEAEVIKIAHDQFAHYRDRQIDRRSKRPFEQFGLYWNYEDSCWEPGEWKLTVVHIDPALYKLRIPNIDRDRPPHIVRLTAEDIESPRRVGVAILNESKRTDVIASSVEHWSKVWMGESVRDENNKWRTVHGLKTLLLTDADDEYPPSDSGELAGNAAILLSYLDGFEKLEAGAGDDSLPNHSGVPKWIRNRKGEWHLWLKWRETIRMACDRAKCKPLTDSQRLRLRERLALQLGLKGSDDLRTQSKQVGDPPKHGKWLLFSDEYVEALRVLSGSL